MPPGQPKRAAAAASKTRPTTLSEALQFEAIAATQRANEAQGLFSKAAAMLDTYQKEDEHTKWPLYMKKAFKAFCEDFETVAQQHFGAYIRGNPRPPAPYIAPVDSPKTPPTSIPALADSTDSITSRPRSASHSEPHTPPTSQLQ